MTRFSVLARGPPRGARPFALRQGVNLSSEAIPSLIVASLDLQLVRLLRGAIGDTSPIRGTPAHPLGPAPTLLNQQRRIDPEPEILPRRRIEPEPRVEPREVIRLPDRYEPSAGCDPAVVVVPVPVPVECYMHCKRPPAVEPPWRVLPWEEPSAAADSPPAGRRVKIEVRPPDIVHKGSLIDFFI